jgi:hypothetical protein
LPAAEITAPTANDFDNESVEMAIFEIIFTETMEADHVIFRYDKKASNL